MCCHGTTIPVRQGGETIHLDACLAAEVLLLQAVGVKTVSSCCGHGKGPGVIACAPSSISKLEDLGYEIYVPGSGRPITIEPGVLELDPARLSRVAAAGWAMHCPPLGLRGYQEAVALVDQVEARPQEGATP